MSKTSKSSGGTKGARTTARASKKVVRKKTKKTAGRAVSKRAGKAPAKSARKPSPKKAVKPARSPARAGRGAKTSLSRKELGEFREMLLDKRRQLVGDMSGMEQQAIGEHGGGNLSSLPTHMADVGTDNFEHEFTLGLLESEQALLREIDEQLQRIEERTYGVCMGTGKRIPKARLRAKPWAKYTVEFARMLEKGLVRPPDAVSDVADEE